MSTHPTGTTCPVCKNGEVVAEVGVHSDTPSELIPIGPGSSSYYHTRVESFHCANIQCALLFAHPPGKPNGVQEVLDAVRAEAGASRRKRVLATMSEAARKDIEKLENAAGRQVS